VFKKDRSLIAFILIGIGLYFLLQKFNVPFTDTLLSWPVLLSVIGLALIINSLRTKDYDSLLISFIILGIGIHFYGRQNYNFWVDHWAVYLLIVGMAMIFRAYWTKKGLGSGIILSLLAAVFILPLQMPNFLSWMNDLSSLIFSFWPVILIVIGLYLLFKK